MIEILLHMTLSHLTFADDLVLFAETSLDQVENISACLDIFSDSSGEKVSSEKTKVFFCNIMSVGG